jgi:quercetin dioxygenase-like cupin family protein
MSRSRQAMSSVFPEVIRNLPRADIPVDGLTAYLSQSDTHQMLFMEFHKDVELPEHAHAAQMGIVVEGRIELIIDGEKRSFSRGDLYYIPEGVKRAARIYAGYADVTFFNEPKRYASKQHQD